MGRYLNKFSNTINQRQANQILKLLNKQRNQGQIRSIDEFSKKLETLVRELTSTTITPSLNLFMAEDGEIIDSEQYNFMLERLQDDLEAAFEEARNIDEVQKSHEAIIKDVILKNLRFGIAELESKINLYEFINKDLRGFDSALFSTFRESKEGRTTRGITASKLLFTDPRTKELIPNTEDATVELVGERLVLPAEISTAHHITGVRQIFDNSVPQSEMVVEPPGISLLNTIDSKRGTYWIQSLLFTNKQNSVKVKLEYNLGVSKEVSYIQIEPAIRYDMTLEAIHYVDGNDVIQPLVTEEISFNSPISLNVQSISTNRIILTFRNENPRRSQFEHDPKNPNNLFQQTIGQPPIGYQGTIEAVSKELNEVISSQDVKDIIGVTDPIYKQERFYEYTFGIDNVYIGTNQFLNRGIYTTSPLKNFSVGQLGLRVLENRPYEDTSSKDIKYTSDTYDNGDDSRYYLGSLEYWIVKRDYDKNGIIARSATFPIMPLGVNEIHHERLILTSKSDDTLTYNDQGQTIFFTNVTASEGNIRVFRNGELLVDETGNPDAIEGWRHILDTDIADKTPNNGTPMRYPIQIINPTAADIYTVSYTPLYGSTRLVPNTLLQYDSIGGLKVVDLVGNLSARLGPGKIVDLEIPDNEDDIIQTDVYLLIILRQNTSNVSLTPILEEYTLVSGRKDSTKFGEV